MRYMISDQPWVAQRERPTAANQFRSAIDAYERRPANHSTTK
jgi:hypothetical protein